jgi:FtsP/CotA-like multicopper oxidase with cupredoxin domain
VNGERHHHDQPVKVGELQVWDVVNATRMDHPFHLHGFFFQIVDEAGKPVGPLAWKDTVNIPMKTTVRLLVTFDERPGEWMFHCHILDHADGGLMGTVMVGEGMPTGHVHKSQ